MRGKKNRKPPILTFTMNGSVSSQVRMAQVCRNRRIENEKLFLAYNDFTFKFILLDLFSEWPELSNDLDLSYLVKRSNLAGVSNGLSSRPLYSSSEEY